MYLILKNLRVINSAINLGEYIKFKHIPILMRDDITEHRLIGEYEVSD